MIGIWTFYHSNTMRYLQNAFLVKKSMSQLEPQELSTFGMTVEKYTLLFFIVGSGWVGGGGRKIWYVTQKKLQPTL